MPSPFDPRLQDCGDGDGCYPTPNSFGCAPDGGGDMGGLGEPCEFINVCDPGLFCANPEVVPACNDAGCCAPYCDVSATDDCDAVLPGIACVPWYEEGQEPNSCFRGVGACVLPG